MQMQTLGFGKGGEGCVGVFRPTKLKSIITPGNIFPQVLGAEDATRLLVIRKKLSVPRARGEGEGVVS